MNRVASTCIALIALCMLATPAYGGDRPAKAPKSGACRLGPQRTSADEIHLGGHG